MNETIAAIATPLQEGAISIIRMSGDEAISIADKICTLNLADVPVNNIRYGFIIDPHSKEKVDEVLISVFRSPRTFTTEDIVEINCHGGVYITRQILKLCLANGARLATRGEFTQRAFLNGRIDLTQAEAVNDMIEADNHANAQMAMQGIRGSIRKLLEPLIEDILNIIANIEVNIDYPEYDDVVQLTNELLLPMARSWMIKIDEILKRSESGRLIKEGIQTAIVGKPNVGKSSLLNALLEEEKAIVTDIAGTTRDIVEGSIRLGNFTLHLIDTAGIRDTEDTVEKIGIERSLKAIENAQLVIVVLDGSRPLDQEDEQLLTMTKEKTRIVLFNKRDLMEETTDEHLSVCAANGEIEPLITSLHELYDKHLIALEEPTLANERQSGLMMKARRCMMTAIEAMEAGYELDLVTIDIQEAYTSLKEILGEVHREDLLDTLFSNFCLGK